MSQISEIVVRQLPEQHFLSVRSTIDFFSSIPTSLKRQLVNPNEGRMWTEETVWKQLYI